MHPRRVWAIVRKDAIDLWNNKATLGGLLIPIMLSVIWLAISRVISASPTDILVYNPGSSGVVQAVEGAFSDVRVTQAGSAGDVAAAFSGGPRTGEQYAVGLVVPANFEAQVHAGSRPQVGLYFNEETISAQTETLIKTAITNYSRALTNPQAPVSFDTTVINPSPKKGAALGVGRFYAPVALLISLVVGTTFVPQLLIEEKEKKTLRMLMTTPASFEDVLLGKLVVVLIYQLVLTGIVLAIHNAFKGQVVLVILYAVLGGLFSLALGLLLGTAFNTVSAATTIEAPVMIIYVIAGMFVGPLGDLLSGTPVIRVARLLPTYYIAHGVYNATQSLGTVGSNLRDLGIILGSTLVLFAASAWILRRQSAVAGMI
jgi:ABC-2 type transport system permease protein